MSPTTKPRTVLRTFPAMPGTEGAGFPVRRPFPTPLLPRMDPFILLDHMAPVDWAPGQAKGAPDHPHRGFETVSYMLDGRLRHRDSVGNTGVLGRGDVQWMTAGAGIVHSEMPHEDILRNGGRMHGFQLWVNLPRKLKMVRPRYQDTPTQRMPLAQTETGDVRVKVVAGEALGQKAVIETRIPILYLHAVLQPGATFEHPVPAGQTAFAYAVDGTGAAGREREPLTGGRIAVFRPDGDSVQLSNPVDATEPLSALLIAGQPIGEPTIQYGPFVMNTEKEILDAIHDYQAGKMGSIPPEIG